MKKYRAIISKVILLIVLVVPIGVKAEIKPIELSQLRENIQSFVSSFIISNKTPGENILPIASHTGMVVTEFIPPENQTKLTLSIFADPALIKEPRGLSVLVEQIPETGPSWIFGGMEISDVGQALTTPGRNGKPLESLTLYLGEQVMREDVVSNDWKKRREILTINDTYYQMAMDKIRVTIRSYDTITGVDADLVYSVVVYTEDKKPVGIPDGHHSASLLGTFTAAEANGVNTVTSGSRTTTAGSLIVGLGASWYSPGGQNNTISDSRSGCADPCNTMTEQIDMVYSTESRQTIAYNIGGTRGASHVITNTISAGNSITVGGGEFDGVASSPTVVSNTATGSGAGEPSVSVTAGSSSLFVGIAGYDSTNQTMTENTGGGWALIVEADENNDAQAFNSEYKSGITGAQTASWVISGSDDWGAGIVAFTEPATTPTVYVKVRGRVNVRGGAKYR